MRVYDLDNYGSRVSPREQEMKMERVVMAGDLPSLQPIVDSAKEATEQERQRALDIVIAIAEEHSGNPRVSAALGKAAHLIRKGENLETAGAPKEAPYYDPITGRCPHGTLTPHQCRDGCEDAGISAEPWNPKAHNRQVY